MFCPKCGHENDNNNGFCMNCGAKFNIDEAMRSELEAQERNGSMPEPKRDIFAEIKGWISENKKKFIILTSTIGGAIVLTGTFLVLFFTHVICFHDWQDATCTEPKTCSICHRTEGEPLGHNMSVATCTEDAKCKRCGYIAEKALGHKPNKGSCTENSVCTVCGAVVEKAKGHKWKDADCENPKTCEICGETEGEPTGHKWKDATCTEPETCEVCGKTKGDSLGHDWLDATYSAPMTCDRCGKTKGEKLELPDISGYWAQENLKDYNHVYRMYITDNGNGSYSIEVQLVSGASNIDVYNFDGNLDDDGVIYYYDGTLVDRKIIGSGFTDSFSRYVSGSIEIYDNCLYWKCDFFTSDYEVKFIRTNYLPFVPPR